MKKFNLMLMLLAFVSVVNVNAQRYLTPQFDEVSVQTVAYGANFTILTLADTTIGHTVKQPLRADIYTPVGDTEVDRPVVLYFHTGNFLPNPQNGSTLGRITDSCVVEVCSRLAKMGYVAAAIDYRQGWNPLSTSIDVRKGTLIGAAYRGIQDARTAIRYFKKTAANGNPYAIDTTKITLWGEGTGGYITLGTATLDAYTDIFLFPDGTPNPKFISAQGFPLVIEQYNGNIWGTNAPTVCDATYNFATGIPVGDTLSIPNHAEGYTSNFQLCVNTGGALGDTTWLSDNDPPMISFHVPTDPFAPYNYGTLVVPTTGDLIVDVAGSYKTQEKAAALGNNDVFSAVEELVDPLVTAYTDAAQTAAANGNETYYNGLFPLVRPIGTNPLTGTPAPESGPWAWWNEAFYSQIPHPSCPPGVPLSACNFNVINEINAPFQGPDFARTYIDSIMGYFAPRACYALGLSSCVQYLGAKDVLNNVKVSISPNPASNDVIIRTDAENIMKHILVFDELGRLVAENYNVNANQFTLQRNGLVKGMYLVQLKFADGIVTKKVIFQ